MTFIYRILTYLFLPVAVLLSLSALSFFMMALGQPALLLPTFIIVAMIIYVFASFSFVQKAIVQQQAVKARLRDWIRVNAFVTGAIALLNIGQSVLLMLNPEQIKLVIDQLAEVMAQTPGAPAYDLQLLVKWVLIISTSLCVLLVTHIILGFRLLRQYAGYFVS